MKTALFVDFDNVYSGLKRISAQGAERFAKRPARWLRWLTDDLQQVATGEVGTTPRRVLVRRCYMNPVMYQQYRRPFHEAGFEIVDCPPMTAAGKTSTDTHLVLDAMDALQDQTRFDEFVVFSADADFSPVLRRLRRHDRRTVVFAAGAMSEAYKASADLVIQIQTFIRDGLELVEVEEDDEPAPRETSTSQQALRSQVAVTFRKYVMDAPAPVPLPTIASMLQKQFPTLRDTQWAGAGGFGALVRQLSLRDVVVDFQADQAFDQARMKLAESAPAKAVERVPDVVPAPPVEKEPEVLSAGELDEAAARLVRRLVGEAPRPVLLSTVGQSLREALPQLKSGWNGASTLGDFLARLRLEPFKRTALEDGSTMVVYEPGRHVVAAPADIPPAVAAMLRAAELPLMKARDFALILEYARPHMGTGVPFEISAVSRSVNEALTAAGFQISARRVGFVLQGLIFGGLDTAMEFKTQDELSIAALGVILSAWSREIQAPADDEARRRMSDWLYQREVSEA